LTDGLESLKKYKKLILVNPGKDIGIISLNDTMLKEILLGGITTISTDFKKMGSGLAEMIRNRKRVQVRNPSSLIIRSSA